MLKLQFSKYQDSKQSLFKTMAKKRNYIIKHNKNETKTNFQNEKNKNKTQLFYYLLENQADEGTCNMCIYLDTVLKMLKH